MVLDKDALLATVPYAVGISVAIAALFSGVWFSSAVVAGLRDVLPGEWSLGDMSGWATMICAIALGMAIGRPMHAGRKPRGVITAVIYCLLVVFLATVGEAMVRSIPWEWLGIVVGLVGSMFLAFLAAILVIIWLRAYAWAPTGILDL